MSIKCPFCDSREVEKIEISESFSIPFCEDAVIPHEVYRCNACEEEGDFDNSLDRKLTKNIDKANLASAPKLMEELTKSGVSMTYLEKALRLPFRTTSRWKRGRISHSSLALLRLIRFSPSLLLVADDNFSNEAVSQYQITCPWDFFKRNTSNPACSVSYNDVDGNLGVSFKGNIYTNSISSVGQDVKWETIDDSKKHSCL